MEQTNIQPATATVLPAYPTIGESWAALGWFLLLVVGLGLFVLLPIEAVGHLPALVKTGLMLGLSGLANVLLVLWLRQRAGASRWLGLRWWGPSRPWVAFGLLPLIVVALAIVLSPQEFLQLPRWSAGKWLATLVAHPMLALLLGCVAAPLTEEALFRGVLLPGLLRNYRPVVAIGQSALLFGLFHFNPAQSLNAFFIGLLLGWVYYRSRSLWLCVALHSLYNALVFGIAMVPYLAKSSAWLQHLSLPVYVGLWLAAALVLAASLVVLVRSQTVPAHP